jgi:hypothetical protein
MKRVMLALAMMLVLSVFAGAIAQSAASSGPQDEQSGFLCAVYDADGNLVVTDASHWIVYSSGKAVLTCVADGTNSTGEEFNEVVSCQGVDFRVTLDGKLRHQADGTSILRCHFAAEDAAAVRAAGGGIAGQS